jgi:hypothetical protein
MLWAIIGIGALILITLMVLAWAACAVAGRADDQLEEWLANHEDKDNA